MTIKKYEKGINWFINADMEDLLDKSVEDDWSYADFKMWTMFKIAQYLERISEVKKWNQKE